MRKGGNAVLHVKDIMHTAYRVEPRETIADVARTMIAHDVECVLVVDDHELLGIITEKDLLRAVLPTGAELCEADRLSPDPPKNRAFWRPGPA
jgi:CBS domain-containing protein